MFSCQNTIVFRQILIVCVLLTKKIQIRGLYGYGGVFYSAIFVYTSLFYKKVESSYLHACQKKSTAVIIVLSLGGQTKCQQLKKQHCMQTSFSPPRGVSAARKRRVYMARWTAGSILYKLCVRWDSNPLSLNFQERN